VLLRAPSDSTRALITAAAGGVVRSRSITFRRAQPDFIQIVPEALSLKAGPTNQLTLTAILRRAYGAPSPGIRVVFSATDTTPERRPRGRFTTPAPSDEKGTVTVKFTTPDTLYKGPLLIRAVTDTPVPVADTVRIQVVP
jgi:hypothetical protein